MTHKYDPGREEEAPQRPLPLNPQEEAGGQEEELAGCGPRAPLQGALLGLAGGAGVLAAGALRDSPRHVRNLENWRPSTGRDTVRTSRWPRSCR